MGKRPHRDNGEGVGRHPLTHSVWLRSTASHPAPFSEQFSYSRMARAYNALSNDSPISAFLSAA